jgi:hypothetical protein
MPCVAGNRIGAYQRARFMDWTCADGVHLSVAELYPRTVPIMRFSTADSVRSTGAITCGGRAGTAPIRHCTLPAC